LVAAASAAAKLVAPTPPSSLRLARSAWRSTSSTRVGLDLLHARDRFLDGAEIGERAAEPAFRGVKLSAGLGCVLDRFLSLLLGADEQDLPAFAHDASEEFTRCIELIRALAQVDDLNSVAGIEDEWLHLGVPATCLVSEVDSGFQQFFNSDCCHVFQ
jgi:hypothetical protein